MDAKWLKTALGLILIVIGGTALYHYQFGGGGKTGVDYDHEWEFEANELRELSIETDRLGLEVRFVASGDGSNSIHITGRAEQEIVDRIKSAKLEGGKLDIDAQEKWRVGFMDFPRFDTAQAVTVALSDEASQVLEELKLSSDSGSLQVTGAAAQEGVIETDSGGIKLEGFQGGKLSIKSDSGSIHASRIQAALTAKTDSGSIQIDRLSGAAEIESDSGSIRLAKNDDSGADIENDSGSVKIEVPASYAGSYDLKSDSGSIESPESKGSTEEVIKVRTDSGSIRISQP